MVAIVLALFVLWYALASVALNTARAAADRRVHHRVPRTSETMRAWRYNQPFDRRD
jgi:hypothetical protein